MASRCFVSRATYFGREGKADETANLCVAAPIPHHPYDLFLHLIRMIYICMTDPQAGQNCIGIELFLVPSSLHTPFISSLLPRVQSLRVGTDIGSIISHTPIARLEALLAEAVSQGARVLCGGKRYHHPDYPHGAYFEPTMVVDVTMDMRIAQEELFAPVMTVVKYEDDHVDQAVQWLREGRYGLGASVWGNDRDECRRVAGMMECGMVSINE
jgi:acyl-CoA reductase-like NAD-dependent aldehyde dehydrogenase